MKKQSANSIPHALMLCLTALIWGFAFVAQSVGAGHVGTFTFLAVRNWIAAAALVPVLLVHERRRTDADGIPGGGRERRFLYQLAGGALCGAALFLGSAAQQAGIAGTTTAKAGFITALYVIIVPVISILAGRSPDRKLWLCVFLALAGLYLLCMKSGQGGLNGSDLILLLCAFLFSLQIMAVSFCLHFTDGVRLAVMQTVVTAVLSSICVLLFEHPTAEAVRAALPALLYAGLFSSAVGFTLQIIAQERLEPTVASLIMCLESVFSAVGGWLLLGQALNTREIAGCVLMFAAIVLSQIPSRNESGAEGAGAA
ncbi:MAG: DMT family transporter [Lachnospiraceae bacterium]|nr:DMT family transporter [Lachnospiraceae bacterium]